MKRGKQPKQVICVDTGVIYESVEKCHKEVGVWSYNITKGIPYKGMMYEYYNPSEHPGYQKDDEFNDLIQVLRNLHPEYNKITQTMTAKEYADYLKNRKER